MTGIGYIDDSAREPHAVLPHARLDTERPSRVVPRLRSIAFVLPLLVACALFWPIFYDLIDSRGSDYTHLYWLALEAKSPYPPIWFFPPGIQGIPAFEPWYIYYGGLPLWLVNRASYLLHVEVLWVYRASYLLAAIAYGYSISYIALKFRVDRLAAFLLGSTAIAAPYYLTNAFRRGTLTEFAFVSLAPCVIAAGLAAYTGTRRATRIFGVCAMTASTCLLLTMHSLSLLMSALFISVSSIALLAVAAAKKSLPIGDAFGRLKWRTVSVAASVASGLLFASMQVVPQIWTASRTKMSSSGWSTEYFRLSSIQEVFYPFPHVPENPPPELAAQTTTWLAVWLLVFFVLSWRALSRTARLLTVAGVAVLAFSLSMTSWGTFLLALPEQFGVFQFPYRFVTYVTFALIGLAILLLSPDARAGDWKGRTALIPSLGLVAILTFVGAVWQVYHAAKNPLQPDSAPSAASEGRPPGTWYAPKGAFRHPGDLQESVIPFASQSHQGDWMDAAIRCTGDDRTAIPLPFSGPLLIVEGATVLGANRAGFTVIDTSDCRAGKSLDLSVHQATAKGLGRATLLSSWLAGFLLLSLALATCWRPKPEPNPGGRSTYHRSLHQSHLDGPQPHRVTASPTDAGC